MKDFIKKYEVWIFLTLAPLISTIIVYARIKGIIPGFAYTHGRFYALLFLLVCIVKFTRGNEGIKDVFRPMLNWRVHPKWYLFSLLFALTIATITLLLKGFYNGEEFFSLVQLDFSATSFRAAFFILIWAFVGEVVWVSYSVRQLTKITKPFYASQIVGAFWTLWWVPVVYLNAGVITDLPIWPLLFNMLGAAGMCTVIYGKTKSGICVWLLQYMLNMSILLMPVSPRVGGIPTYTAFSIIYFITMLVFMYFMNPSKTMKATD
ncbi:hypothetical protein H0I23_09465 [Cellulophaga sp. HaHaR_3_176]|uniref:hypothetical protein n=1 Tax=Cellulophaga sp. HaHaR_3_176 TaxID=1942464 RepID=UPI001C1FDD7E|nr:hypothetical protein [Cellulophaga sp. HaHaR_3_176]QWX82695.1 hypothetical protein H0I23_09465 [Cellulophaga sp. HaHaR_3_176]